MARAKREHAQTSAPLCQGCRAECEAPEGTRFMSRLVSGAVAPAEYARYLQAMQQVYVALEAVGSHLRDDPGVGSIIDPRLCRLPGIHNDLFFWADGAYPPRSAAAATYAHDIHETLLDPRRFLAHHYTRYLGDITSAHIVAQALNDTFRLVPDVGLEFYAFPEIPHPAAYVARYRGQLESLPLSPADRHVVAEELLLAADHHEAIFAELNEAYDEK